MSLALIVFAYCLWLLMLCSGHMKLMHARSYQQAGGAVQPASHHRPSFGTSPTTKPTAGTLPHPGVHRQPSPRPLPLAQLAAGSVPTSSGAGFMAGSMSHPLVGSLRQTGPKTVPGAKATTLPSSLLADADYMHRFRFLVCIKYTLAVFSCKCDE